MVHLSLGCVIWSQALLTVALEGIESGSWKMITQAPGCSLTFMEGMVLMWYVCVCGGRGASVLGLFFLASKVIFARLGQRFIFMP